MAAGLQPAPTLKRPAGQPCCEPLVYPAVSATQAERIANLARALSDPIRVQLVSSNGGCWEATYSTTLRNQTDQLKAKAD